ncbi:hypothetical protein DERP_006824, partial [Dermatophagoides pteronyssinus]
MNRWHFDDDDNNRLSRNNRPSSVLFTLYEIHFQSNQSFVEDFNLWHMMNPFMGTKYIFLDVSIGVVNKFQNETKKKITELCMLNVQYHRYVTVY